MPTRHLSSYILPIGTRVISAERVHARFLRVSVAAVNQKRKRLSNQPRVLHCAIFADRDARCGRRACE